MQNNGLFSASRTCTAPTSIFSSSRPTADANPITSTPSSQVLEDPIYSIKALLPINKCIISVYGDMVHLNDGTHLNGGIDDDEAWQQCWQELTALPCQ
eukprot:12320948-Ditylum_brightwellii.AAC.1